MISRHARRSGRPQESLRQFALNTTGGVDSTRPPTDFDTVYSANNLITNPDGSLSLRKPITVVENTVRDKTVKQYYLYDKEHRLIVDGNTISITNADGDAMSIRLTCTKIDGTEYSVEFDDCISDIILPQGYVSVLNLSSTTVLGNCEIAFNKLGYGFVDYALYDSAQPQLPRYVQVYYATTDDIWTMAIKSPELNEYNDAEGEIAIANNLTLDNAYAIRDNYDQVVPRARGILAYASSKLVNGQVLYDSKAAGNSSTYTEYTASDRATNTPNDDGVWYATTLHIPVLDQLSNGESITRGTFTTDFKFSGHTSVDVTNGIVRVNRIFVDTSKYKSFNLNVRVVNTLHNTRSDDTLTFVHSEESIFEEKDVQADPSGTPFEFKLDDYTAIVPSPSYTDSVVLDVSVTIGIVYNSNVPSRNVKSITESVRTRRYRPVLSFKEGECDNVVLKAFCNLPNRKTEYYAMWFESTDYITWTPLHTVRRTGGIHVRELDLDWKPFPNDDSSEEADREKTYLTNTYYPLFGKSSNDTALHTVPIPDGESGRIDCVYATFLEEPLTPRIFRFKVIAVERISDADPEWDSSGNTSDEQYRVLATLANSEYSPIFKSETTFMHVDIGNTVYGKKLYNNRAIYSYGSEKFFNNIFATDIDSFITPLYNVIDLDTHAAARVSCLIPWRDYLVSATENAMYLHSKQSEGFYTKTVNASIGVPVEDANCCKSILNGVLFKSGPKIYQLYPNMYSGDDSTLNLTEISRAVEDYVEEYAPSEHLPFAFSTASEYVLMLPNETDTTCLRYDFSAKNWTVCTYPIVATSYELISVDDIRIFGICGEDSAEFRFDSTVSSDKYGDVLPSGIQPIEFEWDTGQKTDNIATAKQFVESKLMFATEDSFEDFNVTLTVAVDGDPHVTTLDVSSDAPFWRTDAAVGALNTSLRLGDTAATGLFRQLIVRYSGKGRSVRHILSGKPTSNFRLYETYVRYKTLNVKR